MLLEVTWWLIAAPVRRHRRHQAVLPPRHRVPLTVKTNDPAMPDNEFVLQPGIPFVWPRSPEEAFKDSYGVAVVTNITVLHVVNESAETAGQLRVAALVDPTV